mgnify:CR=1 FL=1
MANVDHSPSHNYLWFAGLSVDDLRRLRASVRRVQMRHYPSRHISDHETDKIIASMGPQSAENQVKELVDAGQLDAKIISLPSSQQKPTDAPDFKIIRRG